MADPDPSVEPLNFLASAVASYAPYLDRDGRMTDPVIGRPTQYGTAYHALCHAVLAARGEPESRAHHLACAARGFDAALSHLVDPARPAHISELCRESGTIGRVNHRDFSWPPLVRILGVLQRLGAPEAGAFAERIAAVDIVAAVRKRPPSNWAMVWISGEWLRYRLGLAPFSIDRFDDWLAPFFCERISLDLGLYQEPGHPNAYDLFTRFHIADMLIEGYDGQWRPQMAALMDTGLARSLAMQLSDGSLASAHRSTGQTWTLGAQCAYFTHAARWFAGRADQVADARADQHQAMRATQAARRAFASLVRWQRQDGPYSPVENRLPPAYRVGYEDYTADGHYGNLALGFLAVAIDGGMGADASTDTQLDARPSTAYIENDPTYRALAHAGRYSVHINGFPAPAYDGFGVVDVTFGSGRLLHFASSVRHLESGNLYNLGLATRMRAGLSSLSVMAHAHPAIIDGIQPGDGPAAVALDARVRGEPHRYRLRALVTEAGVSIEEATPGWHSSRTLLIPYVRDGGWGATTAVRVEGRSIYLTLADECICIVIDADVEFALNLPHGYENRRGLCGLLRVDLAGRLDAVKYQLRVLS